MKKLTRHLLYKGTDIDRQNVVWNIAGSFVYALASMVLSFLVIRVVGDDQGGIFSFGFSTLGQQMFIVAYFGIRPFQITDNKGEFSFGEYLEHRSITCILALILGALLLTFRHGTGQYSASKCMILILLVIYKVIDGYADVYESEFQRQGSLYLTGKSNFFRTILSVSVFLVTLAAFEHLLLACVAAVAAQMLGVALFNLDVIHALAHVDWNKGEGKNRKLFHSTVFLFVSTFLDFYVFSAAKYAIDAKMNDAASGYFNLIFMPTSVIYMVANFIISPFLTKLTDMWLARDLDSFKRELLRIGAVILGLTALAVGATAVLGRWVLSVMEFLLGGRYDGMLVQYQAAFMVIVLGGGFYALANLMYYSLVIMRKQKAIFIVYLSAAAAAALLSGTLVSRFGINGAASCYLLLMVMLVVGFGLFMTGVYQNEKKEYAGNGGSEE